jgi:glycosyltransferase involved in cell wall biosynthesis
MKRSAVPRVAICIATYRRPRMLETLLKALDRLTFRKMPEPLVTVVVIDNDADASAREAVERAAGRARWPLCYGIEPRRGISYARNCGVAAVGKDCDFVVFIDDDEVPRRNWLEELLFVQANQDADVVAGPVLSRFEVLPPAWIERGRCFERQRYRTGQQVAAAGAGNVLIRASQLARQSGPFDTRFALSGAEDTHLFMRLHKGGARMVWADEAVVEERVPQSRVNWRWVLQRAYRGGNGYALCELDLRPGLKVRCVRVAKGAARVIQGLGILALAPAFGIAGLLAGSTRVCLGLGMLTGVFGHRYEEYRQVHGA